MGGEVGFSMNLPCMIPGWLEKWKRLILHIDLKNFFFLTWFGYFFPLCSVLKEFEQVPSHLTEELHLFSLDDLVKIKRGQLLPLLKDLLKSSTSHVDGCEVRRSHNSWCPHSC